MYQLIPIDEIHSMSTEQYEYKGFYRDEVSASLNHTDKILSDNDFKEFINLVLRENLDFLIECGYWSEYEKSEESERCDVEGFIIENNLNNHLIRWVYEQFIGEVF